MKKAIKKFQVIVHNESSEGGALLDIDAYLKGMIVLELLKPMPVRCVMVGRSKTVHCSEKRFENTRIGKQIYLESVQTVFGDVDCNEANYHSSGFHRYPFEITEDSSIDGAAVDKSNRLTWSTIKAVLIDDAGREYFADVFTENKDAHANLALNTADLGQNANYDHEQFTTELNSFDRGKYPRVVTSGRFPGRESLDTYRHRLEKKASTKRADGVESSNLIAENCDKNDEVTLRCHLKQSFYEPGESVSFFCQCENNTKKGYKNLSAALVQHRRKQSRRCSTRLGSRKESNDATKQRLVASVVGPAVGPKELVIWESFVATLNAEETNDCWYTLRVEIAGKLLSKVQTEIPVIIMEDPRTPTGDKQNNKMQLLEDKQLGHH